MYHHHTYRIASNRLRCFLLIFSLEHHVKMSSHGKFGISDRVQSLRRFHTPEVILQVWVKWIMSSTSPWQRKHLAVVMSIPLANKLRPVGRQFLLNLQIKIFTFLGTRGFQFIFLLGSIGSLLWSMHCRRVTTENSFFPFRFHSQRSLLLVSKELGIIAHNSSSKHCSLLVLKGRRQLHFHPILSQRSLIKQSLLTSIAMSLWNFAASGSLPHHVSVQNRVNEPSPTRRFRVSVPIECVSWTSLIELTILDQVPFFWKTFYRNNLPHE